MLLTNMHSAFDGLIRQFGFCKVEVNGNGIMLAAGKKITGIVKNEIDSFILLGFQQFDFVAKLSPYFLSSIICWANAVLEDARTLLDKDAQYCNLLSDVVKVKQSCRNSSNLYSYISSLTP